MAVSLAGGAGAAGPRPGGGQLLRGACDRLPPGAAVPAALPRRHRRRDRRQPGAPHASHAGLCCPAARVHGRCLASFPAKALAMCKGRLQVSFMCFQRWGEKAFPSCLYGQQQMLEVERIGCGRIAEMSVLTPASEAAALAGALPGSRLTLHPCAMQVGMVQEMQAATRQLCHSQLSWFRSEPAFRWVDATPAPADVAAAIAAEVASSSPPVGTSPHASHMLLHPQVLACG